MSRSSVAALALAAPLAMTIDGARAFDDAADLRYFKQTVK